MSDRPEEGSLPEGTASRVLERATELEVDAGSRVGVDDLRRAALEAGISAEAFEAALAEVRATLHGAPSAAVPARADRPVPPQPPTIARWIQRAGLSGLGFVISTFSAALTTVGIGADTTAIFSIVLVSLAALGLVALHRRTRDVVRFGFDFVSLWIGFALAWMLIDPGDAAGVLAGTGLVGVISVVLGSILVRLPGGSSEAWLDDDDPRLLSEAPREPS